MKKKSPVENSIGVSRKVNDKTFREITKPLKESAKKSDLKEEDLIYIIHRFRKEK